ncbi:hypothetical protein L7F22_020429, partial [Adiantum nelumboides]|nr:hypothetical protein [Adiantum nelumboides]
MTREVVSYLLRHSCQIELPWRTFFEWEARSHVSWLEIPQGSGLDWRLRVEQGCMRKKLDEWAASRSLMQLKEGEENLVTEPRVEARRLRAIEISMLDFGKDVDSKVVITFCFPGRELGDQ